MSFIFVFFIASGIAYSLFTGNENEIFTIITNSLNDCSSFILKLFFLTGFFSGIMKIAEDSGITQLLCNIIKKTIGRLFSTKSTETKNKIALNISANMIGIGNAATPAGLMAMKELDKENKKNIYPSYDMCKFMLFNTCSVQIIPTTIMALRGTYGTKNPSSIILPVLIVSIASLCFALSLLKIIYRKERLN